MDRSEAEAIYDAGREACVQFIVDLAARVAALEERLSRLEAQARQDSRTSFKAAVRGSAEDACAAAGGGAREGEGVDATGG